MRRARRSGTDSVRHLRAVEKAGAADRRASGQPPPAARHTAPEPREARLATDHGEDLPVAVTGEHDALLLVPLTEPGELLGEIVREMVFERASPRGLVRIRGRAQLVQSHLVRFEATGEPELLQRRAFVRIVAPQRVRLDGEGGEKVVTRSIDISGGGMLLSGPESLELDARMEFKLTLDEKDPPIAGIGRVVRVAKERRGIVFEQISAADRERLIHYVFDRQRLARAKTRGDAL